jgi:DnaJ-class molecular chaperone
MPVAKASTSNDGLPLEKPDEQTLAHVKELEKMALEKRRRDQAAEKMHEARAKLQFYKHREWTEVIQTHRKTFEALRQEAAQSPNKKVPCTICDAKGILDLCVVCDHTGKCPTCRGTGKVFGDTCPTCLGSGKCFLCFGSGKMPCPFSQALPLLKEVITPATPDPPTDLPID